MFCSRFMTGTRLIQVGWGQPEGFLRWLSAGKKGTWVADFQHQTDDPLAGSPKIQTVPKPRHFGPKLSAEQEGLVLNPRSWLQVLFPALWCVL